MSATRRMQLLSWAVHSGAWIIEDDYDSEYRFGGRPIASLQGLDTDGRVIYVGHLQQSPVPRPAAGLRGGAEGPGAGLLRARDATDTFSSTLYQAVMTDFIREGHFARHIRRMRTLYMERRAALVEAIGKHMSGRLEVIGAEAGMQLTALLPRGIDDVAVARKAAQRGVSARPLSTCYLKPARAGRVDTRVWGSGCGGDTGGRT